MRIVNFHHKTLGVSLLLSACSSMSMEPVKISQERSWNSEYSKNNPTERPLESSGDLNMSVEMPLGISFDMAILEENSKTKFTNPIKNKPISEPINTLTPKTPKNDFQNNSILNDEIRKLVLSKSDKVIGLNILNEIKYISDNLNSKEKNLKDELTEIENKIKESNNKLEEESNLLKNNYNKLLSSNNFIDQWSSRTSKSSWIKLIKHDISKRITLYQIIESTKDLKKLKIDINKEILTSYNAILSKFNINIPGMRPVKNVQNCSLEPAEILEHNMPKNDFRNTSMDEDLTPERIKILNKDIALIIKSLGRQTIKNKLTFDLFQCLNDCKKDVEDIYLNRLEEIENKIKQHKQTYITSIFYLTENHLSQDLRKHWEDSDKKEIIQNFLSGNGKTFDWNTKITDEVSSYHNKIKKIESDISKFKILNIWFENNKKDIANIANDTLRELCEPWGICDYKHLTITSDIFTISLNIARHFSKLPFNTALDYVKKFRHLLDTTGKSDLILVYLIGLDLCDIIIEKNSDKKDILAEAYYQKSQCLDHLDKEYAKLHFLDHLKLLNCALDENNSHQNAINRWVEIYYQNRENISIQKEYGSIFNKRIFYYKENDVSNKNLAKEIEKLKIGLGSVDN